MQAFLSSPANPKRTLAVSSCCCLSTRVSDARAAADLREPGSKMFAQTFPPSRRLPFLTLPVFAPAFDFHVAEFRQLRQHLQVPDVHGPAGGRLDPQLLQLPADGQRRHARQQPAQLQPPHLWKPFDPLQRTHVRQIQFLYPWHLRQLMQPPQHFLARPVAKLRIPTNSHFTMRFRCLIGPRPCQQGDFLEPLPTLHVESRLLRLHPERLEADGIPQRAANLSLAHHK